VLLRTCRFTCTDEIFGNYSAGAGGAAPGRRADLAAMILSRVQIGSARSCGRPLAINDMAQVRGYEYFRPFSRAVLPHRRKAAEDSCS